MKCRMHRIYCLKNKEEKVVYVGQTKKSLKERLNGHIAKYPHRREYCIELITEVVDSKEADDLEEYYIKLYDTVDNGENITFGKGTKGLGANKTSFKDGNEFGKIPLYTIKCIDTGDTGTAKELSELLNVNRHKIYEVCKGKRKTTGKLRFEYIYQEKTI